MPTREFSTPVPYIDHEPDFSLEEDGSGVKQSVELPGFVEIGFVVDGVKVPLVRRKAGNLLPQFDAAKSK